ncbi:RNA polymerase sigma factor [Limnofasciculus baicalensis]|uniref:RNA polymerase sigma factor n=1 Tax=Limnofasciculus baicalensis BBK-W-15 TaxID=2699891 RepID=A0AAE3GVR3_9CYAN|nr:RNA polymerase sigma factor [Limnofasciculus baicalensis]MCP2730668.1 RNA polymerase sigma factor [Limnofasciculus baicalensis BBK-W-15]
MTGSIQWNCREDREFLFFQEWENHRDYLYRCCLKWMNGNATNAEEVLSQAMFKAFEKVQDSTSVITNFKGWLTRLTYNLCMDIHRENKKFGDRSESWELIVEKGEEGLVSLSDSPESIVLRGELAIIIQCAIEDLPPKLREPFLLYFIEEKSYQEIAQKLNIAYDNLRKRIAQAQIILQKSLTKYLSGLDNSLLNFSESLDKKGEPGVGSFYSDEIITTSQEITPSPQEKEGFDCSFNYQVDAICLETLSHTWYQSPTPLGWS